MINPVDETKLSCYTSHRRSTTVSLETYPSINYKLISTLNARVKKPKGIIDRHNLQLHIYSTQSGKCPDLRNRNGLLVTGMA